MSLDVWSLFMLRVSFHVPPNLGSATLEEKKICYKMVYFTLCLGSIDEKPNFVKKAWHLRLNV